MSKAIHMCGESEVHLGECSDCEGLESRVEKLEECCEDVKEALDGKQDTLESGVNIKTINGDSLLGSGDMVISSGGDTVSYTQTQTTGNELGTITINGAPSKIYGVDYSSKQDALVSGTNIKTVNNNSLLGSGNISIPSGDTVSYTQTQTSGDELGTITINGTGKKIYGKDYSSKQDALVSGTNIKTVNNNSLLGSGDVAVQEVLVSGTNIKTINNNSLLGSGNITISGGGGDTVSYTQTQTTGNELGTITINGTPSKIYGVDYSGKSTVSFSQTQTTGNELGTITINGTASKIYGVDYSGKQDALVSGTNIKTVNSTSLLGSGDISVQSAITSTTVSITVANWNATTTCTKSVTGVTSSNNIIVTPVPASINTWNSNGVYCSAQGSGTLTFTASTTPSADMIVNVMII